MTRAVCKGTKADGTPCRSTIVNPSTGYCEAHGPGGDEKMKLRAALGGWKAHHGKGIDPEDLGNLVTVADAQRWLRLITRGAVTGKLKSAEASAGVKGIEAWLRAEQDRVSAEDLGDLKSQLREIRTQLRNNTKMEVVK